MHTYIIYACPTGELAAQLSTYFQMSRATCGPNTAHRYMPHCTLTGFFHDQPSAIPIYVAALEAALVRAGPTQPKPVLTILGMELRPDFHVLPLDSPWLKGVIADFGRNVDSPTRQDTLRLKDWLHLSLAYEFAADQATTLAKLAEEFVDMSAPVGWDLRFYERHADWSWVCHAEWQLD